MGGLEWLGRADRGRVAQLDTAQSIAIGDVTLEGQLALAIVWTRAWGHRARGRVLAEQLIALAEEFGPIVSGRLVALTSPSVRSRA